MTIRNQTDDSFQDWHSNDLVYNTIVIVMLPYILCKGSGFYIPDPCSSLQMVRILNPKLIHMSHN